MIQDLIAVQLNTSEALTASDLDTVVEKLNDVVNISIIQPSVGASIVNVIGSLLLSKTDITPVADT